MRRWHTRVVWPQRLADCATPSHSAGPTALRGIPVLDPLSTTEVNDTSLEPGAPDFNSYPRCPKYADGARPSTRAARPAHRVTGTGSSNPFPSSAEARANATN